MQTILHKSITKASKASATDKNERRHYLKGVYIEQQKDSLIIVGSDGHRLTRIVVGSTNYSRNGAVSMILSSEGVKKLSRDATVLDFNSPDKVDGKFPQYSRFIPDKQSTPTFTYNREDLITRIKSLLVGGVKKKSQSIVFDDNRIENLTAARITDKSTCFNAAYLLDMLATMDGKTVEIHQEAPLRPALFLDPADETFTGVIMPIRT